MPTLQQQIAEAFLAKLATSRAFDAVMLDQLRRIVTSGTKPKPDDLIKIFSANAGGDLK